MARDTITPLQPASGVWRRALVGFAAVLLVIAAISPAASAMPMDAVAVSAQACTMSGTGAADRLVGSTRGDVICGRGGRDLLDDALFGGAGADDLRGGPGDDGLGGGFGPDELSGGPGRDIAYYGQRVRGVRVSLGGGGADGRAVEGDDIHSDVEDIRGGRGNDARTRCSAETAETGSAVVVGTTC